MRLLAALRTFLHSSTHFVTRCTRALHDKVRSAKFCSKLQSAARVRACHFRPCSTWHALVFDTIHGHPTERRAAHTENQIVRFCRPRAHDPPAELIFGYDLLKHAQIEPSISNVEQKLIDSLQVFRPLLQMEAIDELHVVPRDAVQKLACDATLWKEMNMLFFATMPNTGQGSGRACYSLHIPCAGVFSGGLIQAAQDTGA